MIPAGLVRSVRHLTVLPAPSVSRDVSASGLDSASGRDTAWFPVVGVVVGLPVAALLALPIPALPRAAVAVVAWVAITGGLHEDALMDSADAAFAVAPRVRRLEILKDPRAGAHAVSAGGLALLTRFAALAVAPPVAAIVAAIAGRWVMALALACVAPARREGLGARYAAGARAAAPSIVAFGILAVLATVAGPLRCALAAAAAAGIGMAAAFLLARRFGGLTGDGYGAAGLVAEIAALYAFVPVAG